MLNDKFQKPHHNRVIGIVLIVKINNLERKEENNVGRLKK